jgi:uncharacterized protein YprB with RNaseH-like and TPR domain
MIRNTFSILNGVGEKLERRLWRSGVLTWEDFLHAGDVEFLSPARKAACDAFLAEASARLYEGDAAYFRGRLKSSEHWRLFDIFRGRAVCLDIESNGYPAGAGGYPTVVGLYDGVDYKAFVIDEDLTAENLMERVEGYKYLVTFFGSAFDVPFLERTLPGFRLNVPHFDLCFGSRRLGMRGGLKKIERTLGIEREEATRDMDGYDAVLLWERALRGSAEALELLVAYNREDTVNLMDIAAAVYNGLRSATGIEAYANAAA